jgi:threonine dehydratase
LAAGLRLRERLTGKRVVMILSGGNASREQLVEALGAASDEDRGRDAGRAGIIPNRMPSKARW